MNGKVNGRVFVGSSPSPVALGNNDLHSYVVANDGRASVAISNIPGELGPSLLPLASLAEAIGWAFALEQPGYRNGFSLIGERPFGAPGSPRDEPFRFGRARLRHSRVLLSQAACSPGRPSWSSSPVTSA